MKAKYEYCAAVEELACSVTLYYINGLKKMFHVYSNYIVMFARREE